MKKKRAHEGRSHPGENREGSVMTRKETDRPRRTHILEMVERDLSGPRKKPTDRGALTLWRRRREGLVRTRKETNRPRHTHNLETAEGGTCQDTERNRPTKAHSLPGDGRGRDLSGHGKEANDQGTLTT